MLFPLENTVFKDFLQEYPTVPLGVLCVLVGGFLLLAAIRNWNFVFGNVSRNTYDPAKIDGQVNLVGRKAARIISGIGSGFLVSMGIVLLILNFS